VTHKSKTFEQIVDQIAEEIQGLPDQLIVKHGVKEVYDVITS
jgi:hypothetical protein